MKWRLRYEHQSAVPAEGAGTGTERMYLRLCGCAVKFLCPIPINHLIENTFILLRAAIVIAAHRLRHEQYGKTNCHSETDSNCADSYNSFRFTVMAYALHYKLADPPNQK